MLRLKEISKRYSRGIFATKFNNSVCLFTCQRNFLSIHHQQFLKHENVMVRFSSSFGNSANKNHKPNKESSLKLNNFVSYTNPIQVRMFSSFSGPRRKRMQEEIADFTSFLHKQLERNNQNVNSPSNTISSNFSINNNNDVLRNSKGKLLANVKELINCITFCCDNNEIDKINQYILSISVASTLDNNKDSSPPSDNDPNPQTAPVIASIDLKPEMKWIDTWLRNVFVNNAMQPFPIHILDVFYPSNHINADKLNNNSQHYKTDIQELFNKKDPQLIFEKINEEITIVLQTLSTPSSSSAIQSTLQFCLEKVLYLHQLQSRILNLLDKMKKISCSYEAILNTDTSDSAKAVTTSANISLICEGFPSFIIMKIIQIISNNMLQINSYHHHLTSSQHNDLKNQLFDQLLQYGYCQTNYTAFYELLSILQLKPESYKTIFLRQITEIKNKKIVELEKHLKHLLFINKNVTSKTYMTTKPLLLPEQQSILPLPEKKINISTPILKNKINHVPKMNVDHNKFIVSHKTPTVVYNKQLIAAQTDLEINSFIQEIQSNTSNDLISNSNKIQSITEQRAGKTKTTKNKKLSKKKNQSNDDDTDINTINNIIDTNTRADIDINNVTKVETNSSPPSSPSPPRVPETLLVKRLRYHMNKKNINEAIDILSKQKVMEFTPYSRLTMVLHAHVKLNHFQYKSSSSLSSSMSDNNWTDVAQSKSMNTNHNDDSNRNDDNDILQLEDSDYFSSSSADSSSGDSHVDESNTKYINEHVQVQPTQNTNTYDFTMLLDRSLYPSLSLSRLQEAYRYSFHEPCPVIVSDTHPTITDTAATIHSNPSDNSSSNHHINSNNSNNSNNSGIYQPINLHQYIPPQPPPQSLPLSESSPHHIVVPVDTTNSPKVSLLSSLSNYYTLTDNTDSLEHHTDELSHQTNTVSSSSYQDIYKVFVTEIPLHVSGQDIVQVFSKLGNVDKVELTPCSCIYDTTYDVNSYNNDMDDDITVDNDQAQKSKSKKKKKVKNKRKSTRRNRLVLQNTKPDGYAFVYFSDYESYERVLRDDFRILGVNIKKDSTCFVQSANAAAKILYIEIIESISYGNLMKLFESVFGSQFTFSVVFADGTDIAPVTGVNDIRPIFLHVKFKSHQEAYQAFSILQQALNQQNKQELVLSSQTSTLPSTSSSSSLTLSDILRVTWCKSIWYRAVAKKEKEFRYERLDNIYRRKHSDEEEQDQSTNNATTITSSSSHNISHISS